MQRSIIAGARRALQGGRQAAGTHRRGAAALGALAAGDVAYRLFVRTHVRRALGVQQQRA